MRSSSTNTAIAKGKGLNRLPYRDAAIVINAINLTDIRDVLDKANHIAAIHIYPRKNMTQSEKITQLILDYLVCLGKNDDDYDEKGEWEFELEEKLNAVYDAAWYSLGFPSLAEIQQIKASESEIMETVKHYSAMAAELTTNSVFTASQILANSLDISIDKKAQLLAEITTQKENVPLYTELKLCQL